MEINAKKTAVRQSVYQVNAAKILQQKTLQKRSLSEGLITVVFLIAGS